MEKIFILIVGPSKRIKSLTQANYQTLWGVHGILPELTMYRLLIRRLGSYGGKAYSRRQYQWLTTHSGHASLLCGYLALKG